jgi:drug/metabolite transporter (DMT)-like permease
MSSADLGYLIAFLSMFVASVSTFPFTDAAREWGSVAINHFRLILAFIILTPMCMLMDKLSIISIFATPSAIEYLYVASSGIIGLVIGDYFMFHSMAILGAKQSSIFNTLAPGAALLFGYLILNESLNVLGIVGVVISIGGMIWFLWGSGETEDKAMSIHDYGSTRKGIIYGVLSGLAQGFHITLSKKGLMMSPHLSPVHATWIRVTAAFIAYFTFTIVQGKLKTDVISIIRKKRHIIPKATYATIFGLVLSIILVMWSVTLAEVSVIQTILSLGPLIVVPLAYLLYKERISYQTMLAAILSIGGVVILIWRSQIVTWVQMHLH